MLEAARDVRTVYYGPYDGMTGSGSGLENEVRRQRPVWQEKPVLRLTFFPAAEMCMA